MYGGFPRNTGLNVNGGMFVFFGLQLYQELFATQVRDGNSSHGI